MPFRRASQNQIRPAAANPAAASPPDPLITSRSRGSSHSIEGSRNSTPNFQITMATAAVPTIMSPQGPERPDRARAVHSRSPPYPVNAAISAVSSMPFSAKPPISMTSGNRLSLPQSG